MTSPSASTRTLKVRCGDDTRRFVVALPEQATPQQTFAVIEEAVRHGFELGDKSTEKLLLQYLDDENDKCTLLAPTVEDLLGLYPQGVIKLQMERQTVVKPAAPGESAESQKAAAPHDSTAASESSSVPNQQHWSCIGDRLMANFTMGVMLPMAAQSANQPERRAASNEAGVKQREALLPLAVQLLEHADRIPESRDVKGSMQQYVDGSDPAHFGDACADILQAWAHSPSKQEVHESFKACVGTMMRVLPAMRKGHGKSEWKQCNESNDADHPSSDGANQPVGQAVPEEAEAASAEGDWHRRCHMAMMLHWAAASADCRREANNEAGQLHREALLPVAEKLMEHVEDVPESCHLKPALQQFMDGSCPANFGDTSADILQAWAQSESKKEAEESFQACLATFREAMETVGTALFGKGKGKGKGKCKGKGKGKKGLGKGMKGLLWWWQRAAEMASGGAAPSAEGQEAEDTGAAKADCCEPQSEPKDNSVEPIKVDTVSAADAAEAELQAKIEQLAEMGLVMDRDVAKEMLQAHGGDTAAVATLLMS